jgi:hypothetical protein
MTITTNPKDRSLINPAITDVFCFGKQFSRRKENKGRGW